MSCLRLCVVVNALITTCLLYLQLSSIEIDKEGGPDDTVSPSSATTLSQPVDIEDIEAPTIATTKATPPSVNNACLDGVDAVSPVPDSSENVLVRATEDPTGGTGATTTATMKATPSSVNNARLDGVDAVLPVPDSSENVLVRVTDGPTGGTGATTMATTKVTPLPAGNACRDSVSASSEDLEEHAAKSPTAVDTEVTTSATSTAGPCPVDTTSRDEVTEPSKNLTTQLPGESSTAAGTEAMTLPAATTTAAQPYADNACCNADSESSEDATMQLLNDKEMPTAGDAGGDPDDESPAPLAGK